MERIELIPLIKMDGLKAVLYKNDLVLLRIKISDLILRNQYKDHFLKV